MVTVLTEGWRNVDPTTGDSYGGSDIKVARQIAFSATLPITAYSHSHQEMRVKRKGQGVWS